MDKIYLDFDRTLFDTDTFIVDLYEVLGKKIDLSLFKKYYSKETGRGFNPYHILEVMAKEEKINLLEVKHDLDLFMNNLNKYVYDDTIPFLEKIKDKYEINLLTYGDVSFQKMKVDNTDIGKYINNFIDTLSSKGEIENINYQESIFIDDNPIVIDSINNAKRLIRIRRDNTKFSSIDNIRKVEEVKNLLEIKL